MVGSSRLWGDGFRGCTLFWCWRWFQEADNKPLWEGILAAVAALMVLSMVIYMLRAARRMRSDIAAKIDNAAGKSALAHSLACSLLWP